MKIHVTAQIALVTLATLLATSCSKAPEELILGNWNYVDEVLGSTKMWKGPDTAPETQLFGVDENLTKWSFDFAAENKVKVTTSVREIDCDYEFSPEENKLVVIDSSSEPNKQQEFTVVSLEGKKMVLEATIVTEMNGSELIHFVAHYIFQRK